MNCPTCNTPNDPNNQFCISCGQPLGGQTPAGQTPAGSMPLAHSAGELLGVLTIRTVLVLIGLWLVRLILNWLPFVKEMRIPGINISMPVLITCVIYLAVAFVLLGYAQTLRVLWPQSFPNAPEFGTVLAALVYLGVLAAIYFAFKPVILVFATEPDVMTVFQAILFVIAVVLIVQALIILYRSMPRWLAAARQYNTINARNQVACLSCGRLNPVGAQHCSHCGAKLSQSE